MSTLIISRNSAVSEALWFSRNSVSYDELERFVASAIADIDASRPRALGIEFSTTVKAIAMFSAAISARCPVVLLPTPRDASRLDFANRRLGVDRLSVRDEIIGLDSPSRVEMPSGSVVILTSGTTGEPKAVRHTIESLMRPVRLSESLAEARWLATYPLHLYAGLQVLLHALANGGTLVIPTRPSEPDSVLEALVGGRVTHVSASPSFWRWILLKTSMSERASTRIRQITLGGEAAPQRLLDSLRESFPNARIVHVYATSELGRCFSVTDGREGFPARLLDEGTPEGGRLRVIDGELHVNSKNSMSEYLTNEESNIGDDGWFPTGDLVQRHGDRILFRGRKTEVINVGGYKVNPLVVEETLRSHPSVIDARVYGKRSSLVGWLVASDVVLAENADSGDARRDLAAWCRDHLPEPERPRILSFVRKIELTRAGKVSRGGQDEL